MYIWVAGYSGGLAAVVGSVLVTNLKTGKRKGGWARAEVCFITLAVIFAVIISKSIRPSIEPI